MCCGLSSQFSIVIAAVDSRVCVLEAARVAVRPPDLMLQLHALRQFYEDNGTLSLCLMRWELKLSVICATQPSHSIALELSKEGHYLSF